MTFTRTQGSRSVGDHFEPDAALTPEQQRLMRGHLERIDLAAYTANRTCLASQPAITLSDFEHLAAAAAHARMSWIRQSLALTSAGQPLSQAEAARLHDLRTAFEELSEAYEGLRRLVVRGYIGFRVKS